MENRAVTAYNLGVVARRAGYFPEETLQASGLYNRLRGRMQKDVTPYGIEQKQVDSISQGWRDAARW